MPRSIAPLLQPLGISAPPWHPGANADAKMASMPRLMSELLGQVELENTRRTWLKIHAMLVKAGMKSTERERREGRRIA